jgi:hypothetical protein
MPKHRHEHREPTHDWQQLRPLLKDPTQLTYEIIRPVILGWETPKERAAETGMASRTIYRKANLFDQAGMASLLPPEPPPSVPKLDKRTLPPPMRQTIVDLKAEYPAFTLHEIATICYAQFGRRPSPHTIQGSWRLAPNHPARNAAIPSTPLSMIQSRGNWRSIDYMRRAGQ